MALGDVVFPGTGCLPFAPLANLVSAYAGEGPFPEVLVFGDSVALRVAREDADKRPLGAMLEDEWRNKGGCLCLAYSAFNLRIYEALAGLLETLSGRPRAAVVMINVRSFSPQWFQNPAWQLREALALIERRRGDSDAPLGPLEDVFESAGFYDEFDTFAVRCELSSFETVGDFRALVRSVPTGDDEKRERLKQIMAFHYGCPLDARHPLLACLTELLVRLVRSSVVPVPVLVPINVVLGRSLHGDRFDEVVQANRRIIEETCRQHGVAMVNLINELPDQAFFHSGSPTEHLRETGRSFLAARISSAAESALC